MKVHKTGALLAARCVLAAPTGCRGGDADDGGGGGIKTDVGSPASLPGGRRQGQGLHLPRHDLRPDRGPFAPLAVPITDAQKAFWKRVNEAGGIGDYEIDVTKYVKDNKYNPQTHNQVYQEIKGNVLALAQTLGSPTTAAILAGHEEQQHRRRAGVLDVGLGVRGRHHRVRRQLLHRVDERRRLRDRARSSSRASWPCTTPATTATTPRPAPSSPPRPTA